MKIWNIIALAAFAGSVPLANWMIGNVGTCIPDGPCVIPTFPGLYAPSGVLVIGMALVARDYIHEKIGVSAAIVAIIIGTIAAATFAAPALVLASAVSFIASELADLVVYAPLRRRNLAAAVTLSGIAGAIVDSAVFLLLAFGSLQFIEGQVIGKIWISLAVGLALAAFKQRIPA